VITAEGFTLGLAVGEGVFEATGSVSSGDAAGVDTSIVGLTVGEDADVEIGDDEGFSIDSDSLWFGVQRESINTDRTANVRMTTRVFF
jgi:FKBP-type peptidyl-prolyl cis-trans isomerase 2